MGEVAAAEGAPVEDGVEVVRGAKGVDGGSVQVVGDTPPPEPAGTVAREPGTGQGQMMVIWGA